MKILLRAMARCGKQLDPRDERDYKVEVPGVVELKLPAFGTVVVFLTMLAEKERYISQYRSGCGRIIIILIKHYDKRFTRIFLYARTFPKELPNTKKSVTSKSRDAKGSIVKVLTPLPSWL